jgi:hypothetical protein
VQDLEALHRLWSDPETIWWGAHTNLDQTRTLLAVAVTEGWWAVEHGDMVVGDVFLRTSKTIRKRSNSGITSDRRFGVRASPQKRAAPSSQTRQAIEFKRPSCLTTCAHGV